MIVNVTYWHFRIPAICHKSIESYSTVVISPFAFEIILAQIEHKNLLVLFCCMFPNWNTHSKNIAHFLNMNDNHK